MFERDVKINEHDMLNVEMTTKDWGKLEYEPFYLGVKETSDRDSFMAYRVAELEVGIHLASMKGIQLGYDELKGKGHVEAFKAKSATPTFIMNKILGDSGWELGYVDKTLGTYSVEIETATRLDALRHFLEVSGVEIKFNVGVTGNKIIAKRIDVYRQLSDFRGKRYTYGHDLLSIIKEENSTDISSAIRVIGKEYTEGTGDGQVEKQYSIKDIVWDKNKDNPIDKAKGTNILELPEVTDRYGYADGSPRVSIYEDSSAESNEELINNAYEALLEIGRPKVQFSAVVEAGAVELGETVAIVRPDINLRYKTRIFHKIINYLDDKRVEAEFGDVLVKSSYQRYKDLTDNIKQEGTRLEGVIQDSANGKNKIFRGVSEPTKGMTVNDLWYKPVGEGETELYRWNGEAWEIEKVSAGLLGGTIDAENGDLDVINLNANNISANRGNFIKLALNEANSSAEITGDSLKYTHSSGNYSEMTSEGFMKYYAGSKTKYHHMTKVIKFSTTTSGGTADVRWIKLGKEFNFLKTASEVENAVSLSLSDSGIAPNNSHLIHRMVITQGTPSTGVTDRPRKSGGQWEFPVTGYVSFGTGSNVPSRASVAGLLQITA